MSRIKNVSSFRMVVFFVAISSAFATPIAIWPANWAVTATSFVSIGRPAVRVMKASQNTAYPGYRLLFLYLGHRVVPRIVL